MTNVALLSTNPINKRNAFLDAIPPYSLPNAVENPVTGAMQPANWLGTFAG